MYQNEEQIIVLEFLAIENIQQQTLKNTFVRLSDMCVCVQNEIFQEDIATRNVKQLDFLKDLNSLLRLSNISDCRWNKLSNKVNMPEISCTTYPENIHKKKWQTEETHF